MKEETFNKVVMEFITQQETRKYKKETSTWDGSDLIVKDVLTALEICKFTIEKNGEEFLIPKEEKPIIKEEIKPILKRKIINRKNILSLEIFK